MNVLSPAWVPSPDGLRRGGTAALWAGLVVGVAGVLGGTWLMPDLMPVVLAVVLGGAIVVGLLRRPFLHLCAVLLASALILHHEPGVQVTEVLYGLYAMFYLATWAFHHRVLEGRRLLDSPEAWMLALFLLFTVALVPVSFMYGGTPHTVVRELTSLVFVAFFFPVREACRRYPHGARTLIGIALALTVFVIIRNVMLYREVLNNAERLADMVAGRVMANEHMLAASALFGAVFLLYARSARQAAFAALLFLASFGALIMSMSRGFWVAFVWGCAFLFWVVDSRRRIRIVVMGALAGIAITGLAMIFFGNFAQAYVANLVERIGSVQGSTTRDVSMLGRIYEGRAALGHIAENPVLGHGVGVPFTFSTILTRTDITTTFVHNGYIYLWYAFGIPGTVLMLVFWWRSVRAGLTVFRRPGEERFARLSGLAISASLFCYTLSAMTSNPFWHKDYILGFGFLTGLACGLAARGAAQVPGSPTRDAAPTAGAAA